MRLPQQKKILREELKGAPDWIDRLITPINTFMETVYNSLNKNITLEDNISCFIQELTYITPSTYPSGVSNMTFINKLKTKAKSVTIMQVYDKDTYTPPSSAVFVPWIENNGSIVIYPITGLSASKTYLVRLLIY